MKGRTAGGFRYVSAVVFATHSLLWLAGWLVFVFAWPWLLGAGGGRQAADTWYGKLKHSALTPPGWVFGVVWTLLYCLMAAGAWQVTRYEVHGDAMPKVAIVAFVTMTTLLAVWSRLMFKMRRGDFAFMDFCFLNPVAWLTTALFYQIEPTAGYCLLPLDAWLLFAFYLNWQTWRLNADFWTTPEAVNEAESNTFFRE